MNKPVISPINHPDEKFFELGLAVIRIEAKAVQDLVERIDNKFAQACRCLLACEGRVVVLGMGKSGHIGGKIAATLASTGTPAFFVHPGEASHGDLGMITSKDVVLAISNSGETEEIITILPLIKRLDVPLVAMTGDANSTLARASEVHLNVRVEQEACPLGLAPTASTTAALAMGDALAIALLEARGFTAADFALKHPNGRIGRLLLRIDDIMRTGPAVPVVTSGTKLAETLVEMSKKSMGMTSIVNTEGVLLGIFTDGDLRRALDKAANLHTTTVDEVMTRNCRTINLGLLAVEALALMQNFKITSLLVVDDKKHIIGAIHMHDLLRAGVG